jgi:iron complex outermembrane receptor protein
VRQEGQQWGDEHGIEVDEYSVQRVEVLRGPSSLMYGSDAMGGVLNISSFVPANEGQVKGNIQGAWNANNRQWGTHASLAGNHNGFIWNAYGSARQAGDYQNKYDGYVLNSRFSEANYGGMVGLQKKWGYTHLSVSAVNQHPGIIEGERNDAGDFLLYAGTPSEMVAGADILKGRDKLVPYQQVQHFKLTSDNSFNLGSSRLSLTVGYQQNRRKEFGEVEHPDEPKKYFDLQTFNYNLAWHLPASGGWRMSLGTNGMAQQNTNRGEELLIPDYNMTDAGLYGIAQKNWDKLTFSGGLRFDHRQINGDEMWYDGKMKFKAFERSFSNVSGAAGLSYKINQSLTLKTNVSRSFRAPSVAELSSNGEHEGTERYEIGNPNLESETSWQWDVAAELNTEHISVSVSPFINRINNFIFYQRLQTASGADSLMPNEDGDLIQAFKFNQQNANLSGLELSVDLHPHPLDWLHWENSITLLRGRFTEAVDNSTNLPLIAPARWLSILRADVGANWKKLSRSYVKLEVDMVGSQNNPFEGYGTETPTAGYVLLNAGAGTQILHKGSTVAIFHLSVNNLADAGYQNHLSRLKYTMENAATGRTGVFNMGRNFTARLIIPFQWDSGKK